MRPSPLSNHLRLSTAAAAVLAALLSAPLAAQEVDLAADDEVEPNTIVVTGARIRGQLMVEQAPVLELEEGDIAAFGASSIAELVQAVASQTGSARGRGDAPPVFLVNGIRVSSFRELRSYPPEAIRKVEVLPEEVAQRFGFPPDRRVMNFILKDDFSSREVELEYSQPDRGGSSTNKQEATLLKIAGGGRLNANLKIEDTSMLTEGERGVIQTTPVADGEPNPADYRSLVADSWNAEATVNWAKAMIDSGSSISANATYERSESRSLSGLSLADPSEPIANYVTSDTLSTSLGHERQVGKFQFNATVDYVHSETAGEYDRRDGTGSDLTQIDVDTIVSKATLGGTLLALPAGDLTNTFDVGFDWKHYASDDSRTIDPVSLTRRRLTAGTSMVVPIAERGGAWGAIGDLNLNLRFGVEDLSDFGTLNDYSAGLTWGPTRAFTLSATRIGSEAAPSLTQLGSPQVETANVSVFDFVTGQSVLATVITGGNPDLLAEKQRDWKFNASWELPFIDNTRLSVDYVRNRSSNVSSAFPVLTSTIEAAFPDRVTRATDGTLLAIDRRPVTFAETAQDKLIFGLTTRGEFGGSKDGRAGGPGTRTAGGRGPGAGGPPRMGFGNDGKMRYFANLTHTIELKDTVLIAEGVPLLDLLDGDATSGYGLSRHTTSIEGGMFGGGKGMRISASYTGPSRISDGGTGSGDLRFGSLLDIDLRLFTNLGQLLKQENGPLKDLRVSLRFENILDNRRKVTDANGDTPLSYQPFLVDPTGRTIGFEVRKMF